MNVPVVDHFQQPKTSSQPLLSEVDGEMEAKITETKICRLFPKDVDQWPDNISEQLREWFLIEKRYDVGIQKIVLLKWKLDR